LGWIGATSAFGAVVRNENKTWLPSSGLAFVPRTPRHPRHIPAKKNRGLLSSSAYHVQLHQLIHIKATFRATRRLLSRPFKIQRAVIKQAVYIPVAEHRIKGIGTVRSRRTDAMERER